MREARRQIRRRQDRPSYVGGHPVGIRRLWDIRGTKRSARRSREKKMRVGQHIMYMRDIFTYSDSRRRASFVPADVVLRDIAPLGVRESIDISCRITEVHADEQMQSIFTINKDRRKLTLD